MLKKNLSSSFYRGFSISLLLICTQLLVAQTEEDYQNLKAANKLYAEGNYQQAADLYQQIADKSFSAPELFYNLGNAYYRLGDYKRAILYYEKALLLNPEDENTRINLEFSQRFIQDKIEAVPKFFLVKWAEGFVNMFSLNTWSWISIFSFIIFLGFIISFLFSKSVFMRKLSVYTGFVSFIVSLTSFYNAHVQHNKLTGHNTAIVFSPAVTVKSSPNQGGTDLFIIHEGLKVTITDESEGWKEIKLSDGKVGWLPEDTIEEI